MDYSKICYKRSFLSQVIVRTDFLKFIPSELLFSETVLNNIVDKFPQKGMQQVMRFEDVNVIINQNESTTQRSTNEGFQQEFKNLDNNKIIISNKYVILEINKYSTFENIMDQYRPILQTILAVMQVIVVRTGVRYINIYENSIIKLKKSLFSPSIGALVNTNLSNEDNGLMCFRSMAMNEYRIGDKLLNFRYGMYNPEYPNAMRHASFVLDYDCFTEERITRFEEVMQHIYDGHDAIQHLFESSISEKLKKVMENE